MTPCPCGMGPELARCCGPLVDDGVPARTAEELMRSRYTAYALARPEHLWRTWHPAHRPPEVDPGDAEWTGLTILDAVDGGPEDRTGVVEFEAHFIDRTGPSVLHERSDFARRGGRWVYVAGG